MLVFGVLDGRTPRLEEKSRERCLRWEEQPGQKPGGLDCTGCVYGPERCHSWLGRWGAVEGKAEKIGIPWAVETSNVLS